MQIINWSGESVWNTLKWKLDQFCANNIDDKKIDVKIQDYTLQKTSDMQEKGCKLLDKERMGFFDWITIQCPDGGILYELIRRRTGDAYLKYYVQYDWKKINLLEDRTNSKGQVAFEYLGRIVPAIFLQNNMLTFHGVLMEYCGKGIVISAASGTGKTTHARLWRDSKNALIINGDRAVCYKENNTWRGIGIPWSGTSGEQINREVKLQAIVILERSAQNEAFRINGLEAFNSIFPHIQYPFWDTILTDKMIDLLNDLLASIPIIILNCLPDLNAVETLERALEEVE